MCLFFLFLFSPGSVARFDGPPNKGINQDYPGQIVTIELPTP